MIRSRWARVAFAALGVAVLVSGCNSPTHEHGGISGVGPLGGQDQKSAYVLPRDVGSEFTDGFSVLQLSGDKPATLLKIESLGGESSFEFLGAAVAGPKREISTQQAMPGWPPNALDVETQEVRNLKIEPLKDTFNKSGYEILMGYRLTSRKPAVRTAIRVTYRIGNKTYRAVLPSAFAYCEPDQTDEACVDAAFEVAGRQ